MKIISKLLAVVAAVGIPVALSAPTQGIVERDLIANDAPKIDDPKFISAIMRAHWYWRRLHCAQDLVWDSELAKKAFESVKRCTKKPQHDAPSNLSSVSPAPGNYTEWIEFARHASHGWHEEEPKYPYQDPHYDAAWGHFTQMVWRDTSRIGCALGHCRDKGPDAVSFPGRFYCFYEKAGNNIAPGAFGMNVWGPVCHDPTPAEVKARGQVSFDWAASSAAPTATPLRYQT